MLLPSERSRKIVLPVIAALLLLLTSLVAVLYLKPMALEASPIQAGGDSSAGQGMMQSRGTTTSTMSMAEMGAMMDEMMGWMDSMAATMSITETAAMSGTLPMPGMMSMVEMGQMMQMMGMMHQKMGQMQMTMGDMMSGTMMCNGMIHSGMMHSSRMEGVEKLWHMHGYYPSE